MSKYIGNNATYGFLTKQVLATDGTSSAFSLTSQAGSPNALLVVYGGAILDPGVDYTLSAGGKVINFDFVPTNGSNLYIIFLGKELSVPAVAGNEPIYYSATGNGSNTDFTVPDVPGVLVPESLLVFVTGVQKKYTDDWTIVGTSTIRFNSAPINASKISIHVWGISRNDIYEYDIGILSNNTYLTASNFAGNTTINLLKADLSDNTVLNSLTGKKVIFSVNNTGLLEVNATSLNPSSDNTYNIGELTKRIKDIYTSGNLKLADGAYIQARNSGNSAYIDILRSSSNNTYLNAQTGNSANLSVNGTTIFGANSTGLLFGANNTYDIGVTGTRAKDIYLAGTLYTGATQVFNSSFVMRAGTADGSDNQTVVITAGGAYNTNGSRGSSLVLWGDDDVGNPANLALYTGSNSSGGVLSLQSNSTNGSIVMRVGGNFPRWQIDSSGQFLQDGSYGGAVVFSRTAGLIKSAADTNEVSITGASTLNAINGAYLTLSGASHANTGQALLRSGSTGNVLVQSGGASNYIQFLTNGTARWNVNGSGHFVPGTSASYDVGTSSTRARNVYIGGELFLPNNSYIKTRNQANSADLSIIGTDTSDNTVLNTSTDLLLSTAGSTRYTLNSTALYPSSNNARDLGTASLSYRTLYLGTSVVFRGNMTISQDTADGSDNRSITMTAGGAYDVNGSRGANILLYGNEVSSVWGNLYLITGAGSGSAGGTILLRSNSAQGSVIIQIGGSFPRWVFNENGQLVQDGSYGGDIIFSRTSGILRSAADTNEVFVLGGTNASQSNGASLSLSGASHANTGQALLRSGSTGNVLVQSGGASNYIRFTTNTTARWNIDGSGHLSPHADNTYTFGTSSLRPSLTYSTRQNIVSAHASNDVSYIENTNASYAGNLVRLNVGRTANSGFSFLDMRSSSTGTPDTEFIFNGDGNALADGSWTGGGADYAEFFETVDGESIPVGTVVVIENEKVRKAGKKDSEAMIIGVVRPKSGVASAAIGNNPLNWSEKYLRDDFGDYLLDKMGKRIINKDYDENKSYTQRRNRKEWVLIGLLGQIPIKNDQKVSSKWTKMKSISKDVDLYFVK